MLDSDRGFSSSDICSLSQGLHEHIQSAVMPEITDLVVQKSINIYMHALCFSGYRWAEHWLLGCCLPV
jgi:hypothetical protein